MERHKDLDEFHEQLTDNYSEFQRKFFIVFRPYVYNLIVVLTEHFKLKPIEALRQVVEVLDNFCAYTHQAIVKTEKELNNESKSE